MVRGLVVLAVVVAAGGLPAQRGREVRTILSFEAGASNPAVSVSGGAMQVVERRKADQERHLRWDSFQRFGRPRMTVGPFAPSGVACTHLRLRMRREPFFAAWRGVDVVLRDRGGRTCRTVLDHLDHLDHSWLTFDVPLAFMRAHPAFDPAAIRRIEFACDADANPAITLIGVSEIALLQRGSVVFPERRPVFDPAAPHATAGVWSSTARLISATADRPASIAWSPEFVGRTEVNALRFCGFPRDLRPYRAVRLRLKASRDVAPAVFSLVLTSRSGGRELAAPVPALGTRWSTVDIPLGDFGGLQETAPDDVAEIQLVACTIDADRGVRSAQRRRPVEFAVGRIECVPGDHETQRWSTDLHERIATLAAGGPADLAALRAIVDANADGAGLWVRHDVAGALDGADPAAMPILFSLLEDDAPVVFERAARSLVGYGAKARPMVSDLVRLIERHMFTSRSLGAARILCAVGEPGIDALVGLLDAPTRGIRMVAANGLARAEPFPTRVLRMLGLTIRRISGPEAEQAADALADLGLRGVETLEKIVLHEKDRESRLVALAALVRNVLLDDDRGLVESFRGMDAVAAAPLFLERPGRHRRIADRLLERALRDTDPRVREAMLEIVDEHDDRDRRLVHHVAPLVLDPVDAVRALAVRIAGRHPAAIRNLIPQSIEGIASKPIAVRRDVAVLLGTVRSRPAVKCLCALLSDPDAAVAREAHRSLHRVSPIAYDRFPEIRAYLAGLPKAERTRARVEGIMIDVERDDRGAVDRLVEVLGRQAIPRLREILRTGPRRVRHAALLKLGALRATEAGPDVRALLRRKTSLRAVAVRVLFLLDDPAAPAELTKLLDHRVRMTQRNAIDLAEDFRVVGAIPVLERLAAESAGATRVRALRALATYAGPSSADAAVRALDAELSAMGRTEVVVAAVRAIGATDPARYVERLRGYLRSDGTLRGDALREVAARGLARIQHEDAGRVLVELRQWRALNHYTAPALCKKLERTTIDARTVRDGTVAELIASLADAARVPIEPEGASAALLATRVPSSFARLGPKPDVFAILAALDMEHGFATTLRPIILPDRIRLVDPKAEAEFWRTRRR